MPFCLFEFSRVLIGGGTEERLINEELGGQDLSVGVLCFVPDCSFFVALSYNFLCSNHYWWAYHGKSSLI